MGSVRRDFRVTVAPSGNRLVEVPGLHVQIEERNIQLRSNVHHGSSIIAAAFGENVAGAGIHAHGAHEDRDGPFSAGVIDVNSEEVLHAIRAGIAFRSGKVPVIVPKLDEHLVPTVK